MQRTNLIKARRNAGYTQSQLAQKVGVRQATISDWENAISSPDPLQISAMHAILNNNAPDLFDVETGRIAKGFIELMEMFRREFVKALSHMGGLTLFGPVELTLTSTPTIAPDEFLAQCEETIASCWEYLNASNYSKVARVLNKNMPVLARLSHVCTPFQSLAANLAVQACLMSSILALVNFNQFEREKYSIQSVHFAQLSGDKTLLVIALDWLGATYNAARQTDKALPLFDTALLHVGGDSALAKSALYIDMSVAYAQLNQEEKARDYAELAHIAIPSYPELDPFYKLVDMGKSELEQAEGKMYLYLAEKTPNNGYGLKAYDAFNKATSKQSISLGYRAQALIRKADSARILNEMDESVTCLTNGLVIALQIKSKKSLCEIGQILNSIPDHWRNESAILTLKKELTHAIEVYQ